MGYDYKALLFTYGSVNDWPPYGRCAAMLPSGAGPPDKGFFPRLETSASKSSGAILFLPGGEGMLDPPPRSSPDTGVLISPVRMLNVPPA